MRRVWWACDRATRWWLAAATPAQPLPAALPLPVSSSCKSSSCCSVAQLLTSTPFPAFPFPSATHHPHSHIGRLLNRFTKDAEAVDMQLAGVVNSALNCFVNAACSLVVVLGVSPATGLAFVPLAWVYHR